MRTFCEKVFYKFRNHFFKVYNHIFENDKVIDLHVKFTYCLTSTKGEYLGIAKELLYLLSISEDGIPEKNRDKLASMFPFVRKMMIHIFSEEDTELIVD